MVDKKDNSKQLIGGGSALAGYGAVNAPVLRGGSKDPSKMVGASPKLQPGRYQGALHQAMKTGEVDPGSTVRVLRTPSGRHINAGGTHRHIAREAMGKPSNYEIKDVNTEFHMSPAQKLQSKVKISRLQRASRNAEAGKKVRPVGRLASQINRPLAAAADIGDEHVWNNASALANKVKLGHKAGLVQAGLYTGAGALAVGAGIKEHKQHQIGKRLMSDSEIKHRKAIQAHVSEATGTLGLLGLGAFTAGRLGGSGKAALKAQKVIPKLKKINPKTADKVALGASTAGGGIGGAGSFNFASYTSAESKKKNLVKQPVVKRLSAFGVDHD